MFRKILSTALVSAAMVVAGPALAGPGGGGGGEGHGGGHGADAAAHGGMGGGGMGGGMGGVLDRVGSGGTRAGTDTDVEMNNEATRINTHANSNNSMNRATTTTRTTGRTSVQGSALPGLTAGATVQTSTGTTLGTVSRILTDRNGNVVGVLVTTSSGRTLRLSPTSLSMNGSILVTNVTTAGTNPAIGHSQGPFHASPTGIAHANSHSVLAGGATAGTSLAGLTTGLAVTNANGTNIGNISRVVTDANGNVRLVIVTNTTTGRTFRLMPSTLTINGTVVTTTSTAGG